MSTQKHPLVGVALGPGDPEMVTLKGYKALQNADIIYYPASSIKGDEVVSFSKPILDSYSLDVECQPLLFPMTGKGREEFYNNAYQVLKAEVDKGRKVVLVNEGDLLFYSTFGYILALANADGMAVEPISGIPAFVAAGAAAKLPIVEGNTSFTVIARPDSFAQIKAELEKDHVVVVMKMKVLKDWYAFLKEEGCRFTYVEKVGTKDEYITQNIADLEERLIPYFALIRMEKNN